MLQNVEKVLKMTNVLKISEAASLAMHTMVYLAAKPGKVHATGEIARTFGVSEAHLSKVLQRLARSGLVVSTRGPGGGFRTARPPGDVTLLEIYEPIEGPFHPTDCLFGTRVCGSGKCILGGLLEEINKRVRDYLEQTRLSDLTNVYTFTQ